MIEYGAMRLFYSMLLPLFLVAGSPAQGVHAAAATAQAASAVQLPYENVEQLLQIARNIHIESDWYAVDYGTANHSTGRIANGAVSAYGKEDGSDAHSPELQLECVIKLFLTSPESAELAWFKSTKTEIRVMILATFYCGMNEKLCCFPYFGMYAGNCFGDAVGAQREAELRWVQENKNALRTVLRPLIAQARKMKKESSFDGT